MNDDFNFVQYNQNFDHEFTDKHEWLNVHINLLFNELKDIWIAVHIFNTVDKEWDKRVQEKDVPDYMTYETAKCPLCQKKVLLDAMVNSHGYSKI